MTSRVHAFLRATGRFSGALLSAGLFATAPVACCFAPGSSVPADPSLAAASPRQPGLPYLQRRSAFTTQLVYSGPSPQPYDEELPAEVQRVTYRSGELELMAWLAVPPGPPERRPLFIYAHGGFALAYEDFEDVYAAYERGYAVFMPTLRGENGNPGTFELGLHEVDDLAAAVRFAARAPQVDASRICLIGHSAGGLVSGLVSVVPDLPLALTGSIDGLYTPELVCALDVAPFRTDVSAECEVRSPAMFLHELRYPHIGYVGTDDTFLRLGMPELSRAAAAPGSRLTLVDVPGDHSDSLGPAVELFLDACDALPRGPAEAPSTSR